MGFMICPEAGMVPEAGLEPALCCQNWILNPARLPISPLRQELQGAKYIFASGATPVFKSQYLKFIVKPDAIEIGHDERIEQYVINQEGIVPQQGFKICKARVYIV